MVSDVMQVVILAVILGTLAAIVYSLKYLVIIERRISRMDAHIEIITRRIVKEESRIESEEATIIQALRADKVKRSATKKQSSKKPKSKK